MTQKLHLFRKKRSGIFGTVILVIFALICFFPFYWAINSSFKTESDMFLKVPQWIPLKPTLQNYELMFNKTSFPQWGLNSLLVSAAVTVFVCIFSSLTGYAMAKIRFRGASILFGVIVVTMMLPKYSMLIPLYTILKNLGWFNTYWGIAIPEIAGQLPFGIFLIRQFMLSVPRDLFEAAQIDGAGENRTFISVAVPMIKPAIASLAILTFVRIWNDYLWQVLVSTKKDMMTVPVGLATLQSETVIMYGQVLAGCIVSSVPLIIVFIVFQKYFTKGISAGAVKG
ncbi:MAG: sugar ABC transporter permease [Clostridiales bacterium]|nr:sugar ABC transporter permease [Clostridiales bacterium]